MKDNKLLNELVKDCITYKLTESEALDYIQKRSGRDKCSIIQKEKGNI